MSMLVPLSVFDSDTQFPNLTFDATPYLYIASEDNMDDLKKIKFFVPNPDTGDEPMKTAYSISTMVKAFNTVVHKKKPWNETGMTVSVKSTLKKEEAALLKGVLYATTEEPDDNNPVFDAWRIPATGTPLEFKEASTAIFLNKAPDAVSLLSNFSVAETAELSILCGVPGVSTSSVLTKYKGDSNTTMDPVVLTMRSFTVNTTGKASFWLGGNAVEESKKVRTAASSGVVLSSEYPSKSGVTTEQNVTYNRKMDFLVTGTFQLNDNAYVLLKFRNVNGNADVTAKNLTGSGTVNITEVAEQLVVQPSSMRAGAFLISYSTEDLGEPESPTGATGKRSSSLGLSLGLLIITMVFLR
ncbi:hypothetical protein OESDEN_08558 [Oesophagostomum dentatum]|uniref:Uncharacterized protein n=1 Tax=Oesophagostomum dentatum TaxID=61180 RepID=A0A0B1T891_OESDE|nr:hypothetical protein OESDEN_08558 [Oesophagostomum dentatum]